MSNKYQHLRPIVRLAFFAGLAGVLVLVLFPNPLDPALLGSDKGQHVIAFLVLSGLGRLGWSSGGWGIVFVLVALGGAIELLQSIPIIARDTSLLDWLADSVGVLVGTLAATAAMRVGLTSARGGKRSDWLP